MRIDKLTGRVIIMGVVGKKGDVANANPIKRVKRKTSRTKNSWLSMKERCSKTRSISTKNYGDRGITICERWKLYTNFLEDMGERPESKTLDRINNDGNYEPTNCKWSTPKEQVMNRRNTITGRR